jgi:hypothetical protein
MKAQVGAKVHPRYKGIANWEIKAIAAPEPIKYENSKLGEVSYSPASCIVPRKMKQKWNQQNRE